jgi:hypothetical protein
MGCIRECSFGAPEIAPTIPVPTRETRIGRNTSLLSKLQLAATLANYRQEPPLGLAVIERQLLRESWLGHNDEASPSLPRRCQMTQYRCPSVRNQRLRLNS